MVLYIYLVLGPEYYHLTLHEVDLHEDDGVDYSPAFYEVDEDVDEPEQVDVCKLERAVEVAVCELERAVETDAYGQEREVLGGNIPAPVPDRYIVPFKRTLLKESQLDVFAPGDDVADHYVIPPKKQ
jgi:hypothetical protein